MSDVVPLNHNRRLTPEEYEQERLSLRETYGDSKRGAGVRYEQELARLFARSGWTQEELAKKEGRSQNYVSAHLCFGRFVKFIAGRDNFKNTPKNLTEYRFRNYWLRSGRGAAAGNERQRFVEVQRMLESDFALHPDKRPTIGPKIIEQLADGQWHGLSEIVKATTAAEAHIHDTLVNIRRHETYEAKCEIRKAGTSDEYRLFKRKKTVGVAELIKKGQ